MVIVVMMIVVMMMTLMVVVVIMMMIAVMMVMMMVLRGNSASCKYPWLSQTADYYPEDTRDNDDHDDHDDDGDDDDDDDYDDCDPDYSLSKPRMGHFCINSNIKLMLFRSLDHSVKDREVLREGSSWFFAW